MQNRASPADSTSASPSNAGRPLPAGSAFTLLNAKPLVAFDSLEFPSLRLGLADPGPVAAGRCVMAIGTPRAQTVAAASIAAEFVRPLHLAAVPASLHAFALLSLFFSLSLAENGRGVSGAHVKKTEELRSFSISGWRRARALSGLASPRPPGRSSLLSRPCQTFPCWSPGDLVSCSMDDSHVRSMASHVYVLQAPETRVLRRSVKTLPAQTRRSSL
jgi:hypothetical protein